MKINGLINKILRNDLTTLILRLTVLYAAWFLCRVVFYLQNYQSIAAVGWNELPSLLRGGAVFDTVSILYVNALFILLSLLPFRFRERAGYQKGLMWLYFITNAAALIINISDGVYFRFARKRFTSDELSYIENNDNNLGIILKSAAEYWYIVIFAALLIAAVLWCYRRIKYYPTLISGRWRYFLINLAILAGAIILVIGGIRGGFGHSTRPITLSNAAAYTNSNLKGNLILSNPFSLIRTLGNQSLRDERYFDARTLDSLYTPYHYPSGGGAGTGRRNVVIFVLESFSAEQSALLNPDLYPDGKGFTPFLDSLMREGFYFTHAFSNGRKSIDALPSILASIPSYRTPFVLLPQALARMEALPGILAQQGYTTSFFNGSDRGSMGFDAFTSLAGIQKQYAREDYESVKGNKDYDGYWGIWDMPFLQYVEETLAEKPQPFFTTIFTLTSHHPFVVPQEYKSLPAGKTKVHRGVQYTDLAVRDFMSRASGREWFENSIFVFVADHVSSETFAPKTLTPTGNSHIIYFIYTPDGSLRGRSDAVTQQTDIMPTVLGLLDNDRPYFAFGRDAINENDRRPMAINFVNQNFQAITDSMVLFFDGGRILSAYSTADTLQRNDISADRSEYLIEAERDLKARLQQYYRHVEERDYIVK